MANTKTKRVKIQRALNYPEGQFTVEDVFKLNQPTFSKVAVYQHVNQDVSLNTLKRLGETRGTVGRPRVTYSKVSV